MFQYAVVVYIYIYKEIKQLFQKLQISVFPPKCFSKMNIHFPE